MKSLDLFPEGSQRLWREMVVALGYSLDSVRDEEPTFNRAIDGSAVVEFQVFDGEDWNTARERLTADQVTSLREALFGQ